MNPQSQRLPKRGCPRALQEKLGQEELRGGVQRGSASEEQLGGTAAAAAAPLTRENPFCPVDDLNTFAGDAVMSSLVSTFTKWRRHQHRSDPTPRNTTISHDRPIAAASSAVSSTKRSAINSARAGRLHSSCEL
ncbi:unnamed protein product [Boreogadus saida]